MSTALEQYGGYEKSAIEIAKGLHQYTKNKVEIISMDEAFTKKINFGLSLYFQKNLVSDSTAKRESLSKIRQTLSEVKYTQCRSISQLRKKLNEFDVIYSKNEIIESFMFKFLIGYKRVPPVLFLCGTAMFYPNPSTVMARLHNYLYLGPIYRFLASGVRGFHTKNNFDVGLLEERFKNRFIGPISNPFDFKLMDNMSKTKRVDIDLDTSKFNILWAARITEQKGVGDLIKIIEAVNNTEIIDSINWYIAGSGEDESLIRDLADNWSNVTALGHIESDKMPNLYAQFNMFIMTSKWESFGNTVVEALSFGLPVISYDIIGPNEIITPGVTGKLVSSVNEFASEIMLAAKHDSYDHVKIRKLTQSTFDIKPMSIKLDILFKQFEKYVEKN